MWWKNYLIVFIVTSVLVLVTMFSCNTAESNTPAAGEGGGTSLSEVKLPTAFELAHK